MDYIQATQPYSFVLFIFSNIDLGFVYKKNQLIWLIVLIALPVIGSIIYLLYRGRDALLSKQPAKNYFMSILAGIVITLLFTAQMNYHQANCNVPSDFTCATYEYGYPLRFISSTISLFDGSITSRIMLDSKAAFLNLLLWTSISYIVIIAFSQNSKLKK